MTTASNKQLLEHIFSELAKGNARPLVDSMADDFSWTVTGNTKWSRKYAGKQVVVKELLGTLRDRLATPIITVAHRFIAEGDLVAVEARGANTTKDGRPYANTYCFVFRLGEGKLQEVTEYLDTELVTAAFGDPAI